MIKFMILKERFIIIFTFMFCKIFTLKKILQSIQSGLDDMKSGKTKAISLRPSENNII